MDLQSKTYTGKGLLHVLQQYNRVGDDSGGNGQHGVIVERVEVHRIEADWPRGDEISQLAQGFMFLYCCEKTLLRHFIYHVPAVLEPIGLARSDGKRPDGMTFIAWRLGRSLVWDATCVDTLAASHIQATSYMVGAAATNAEQAKRRKY
ncbi:jg13453 [Pararge aegeria aegeria]|uniref:Jg13453 protein n=1 Tax=Pararge aegeria aegeria TaxID=348720 RepID=A0A8S4RYZ5_9NEOP|nr:jg13453 [Pararge aegeria aegeria]